MSKIQEFMRKRSEEREIHNKLRDHTFDLN